MTITLEDWEWDMVDSAAAASGLTRQQVLREMIVEEADLVLRGMDALSTAGDRQWKSH